MKKLFILLTIGLIWLAISGFSYASNLRINPSSSAKLRVATSVPTNWWTDGLVGYWSFDGQYFPTATTITDQSNNGNTGTLVNGVSKAGGISGQALNFDGTNDTITIPDANSLDITGAITLEAWVKLNTISQQYFIRKGGANDNVPLNYGLLVDWSGYLMFQFYNAGWKNNSATSQPLSAGNFYHIVATYDGANVRFYVNGVAGSVVPQTNALLTNTLAVQISGSSPTAYIVNGLIDEARIYNRALGVDEVKQHYEQTRRNLRI